MRLLLVANETYSSKNSYSPTITGLKGRYTKGLRHGKGCCNPYHTPTILLLRNLLRNNLSEIEIFRQNKGSYPFPHLLSLRIKIAIIKGKYIFLGRENFLAGLLVKSPCCQHSASHSGKSETRCEIYLLPLKSSDIVGAIVGVW